MNFYYIWGSMPTTQNPETRKYPRSSQRGAVFHPKTIPYWCSGYGWKVQLPWSQRGPVGSETSEAGRGGEASLTGATEGNANVNRTDGDAVRCGNSSAEEEEKAMWRGRTLCSLLIIRRQLGAASCWPLMTNSLTIPMMMLCAVHTGYLHLVCCLPDLFLDKYGLLFKNVLCLTSEDRWNLSNIG